MHFDLNLAHLPIDPAGVVTAWVTLSAAVSLVNRYIISSVWPLAGKIIGAALNILPAHVGQLIADIKAVIADIQNPPGGTPTATAPVTPEPPVAPPAPPSTSRVGLAMFGAALLFTFQTTVFGLATQGCTPAERAEASTIEQLVLHDLQAGKSDQQIESDIAAQLAGQPGTDAVIILNDVLSFLMDSKAIPDDLMAAASAMKETVSPIAADHIAHPLQQ